MSATYQLLPPLRDDEFAELKADIARRGEVLVPVEVDEHGALLDGHHRVRAWQELRDEGVPVRDYSRMVRPGMSEQEKRRHVRALNLSRRHLDRDQRRALIAERLHETPEQSNRQIADALGVSHVTVAGVRDDLESTGHIDQLDRRVGKDGKSRPSVYARNQREQKQTLGAIATIGSERLLGDGITMARDVGSLAKRAQRWERAAAIRCEPPPLPQGPFRIIVADPPWRYEKRAEDCTQRAALPYPSMSTAEVAALPVPALAHDDCVLWLWTTNAHLRDAFAVLDAWAFSPKSVLTWAKDRLGVGDWLRGQTEHCLLAIRGNPVVQLTNETTLLPGRVRDHSRKPEEFYALVERLCPGSKVELFARETREGWVAWGDEAERWTA